MLCQSCRFCSVAFCCCCFDLSSGGKLTWFLLLPSLSEAAVWGNIVLIKLVTLNTSIGSNRIKLLQRVRLYNSPKEKWRQKILKGLSSYFLNHVCPVGMSDTFFCFPPELNYKAFLRNSAQARHSHSEEAEWTPKENGRSWETLLTEEFLPLVADSNTSTSLCN